MEMQQRFLQKSHHQYPEVSFGTFHSVFYQILKREAVSPPQLVSAAFQMGLWQRLWEDAHGKAPAADEIRALGAAISKAKNNPGEKVSLPSLTEQEFYRICQNYDRQLRDRGLLDFDDMILECGKSLRRRKDILLRWQQRFSWILVDEFQDINSAQYEILQLLAGRSANLFTVGDDDQSIYGFRGAAPGIMRRFLTDYPDCQCIQLRHNYRCSQKIITLSQKLIVQNQDRISKEVIAVREAGKTIEKTGFLSAKEEYAFMIRTLEKMTAAERARTAIIVRTHLQGQHIYEALKSAKIPCAQEKQFRKKDPGGLLFYETVRGYFKFSADLERGSARRKDLYLIMNRPERYLPRTIARHETVTRASMQEAVKGQQASEQALLGLLKCCDVLSIMKPLHAVKYLRKTVDIEGWMQKKGIAAKASSTLFDELALTAASMHSRRELIIWLDQKVSEQYANSSGMISSYVKTVGKTVSKTETKTDIKTDKKTDIKKDMKADVKDENNEKDGVHLITMHASKGLEFDVVFLPDLNEGILPSRQADTQALVEEERRLFYVAITRARNSLYLLYVAGTSQSPMPISRFLVSLL